MTIPRTVSPSGARRVNPSVPTGADAPFKTIRWTESSPTASVLALAPGCVKPSMTISSIRSGSSVVTAIVCTPAPGMLKWIASFVP
jgi:hypothetical protein